MVVFMIIHLTPESESVPRAVSGLIHPDSISHSLWSSSLTVSSPQILPEIYSTLSIFSNPKLHLNLCHRKLLWQISESATYMLWIWKILFTPLIQRDTKEQKQDAKDGPSFKREVYF